MNKLVILVLAVTLTSVLCSSPCPQNQYYNATCGKCVECFWDIIDPPNDATFHWCRCNCYQDGQYNLRTDLCFLEGNIFSPPIQECRWRCVGNEATSSNGTFPSLNAYVNECLLKVQCHPTCYECSTSQANGCTKCPVGYKLTANPGYCVKDSTCGTSSTCSTYQCPFGYNSVNAASTTLTLANCCQQTCAAFTCPDGYIFQEGTESVVPASIDNCCTVFVQTVFCIAITCPDGQVQNPATLFTDVSNGDTSICCLGTCSTFTCPIGYNSVNPTSTTLTQANCCQATCSTFTCPSGYNKINSASTTVTQANCCQQTCSAYTCPSGYVANSANTGSTTISTSNCCVQTCGATGFSCGTGFVKNSSASSVFPATVNACCLKTCANPTWGTCNAGDITLSNSFVASYNTCCQPTCASSSVTCPVGKFKDITRTYPDCCITCQGDNYLDSNNNCVPCKWDIINPPNDATYNWCRCNCYTPGTTILNSGVCWVFGNGPQKPPIQECKWVCPGSEYRSGNGTMTLNQWVDSCIMTPQCNSNCYTCSKTNPNQCTSCQNYQTLKADGKCYCANGVASHYGVC